MEPRLQTFFLFLLADVEKELEQDHVIFHQDPLEGVDLIITSLPNCFQLEFEHPDDENIFLMRAVEDTDVAVSECWTKA